MGKLIVGMTLSLDGFVNDRDGSVAELYPDLANLRETDMLQEAIRTTGAVVMGRRTFDMAQGDYTGYEFQVPIFVVTHHPPSAVTKGQNDNLKFHFVTDGLESAVKQATSAAGDKNVTVVGGANVVQHLLQKGLADELEIGIMPVLLGSGVRFFEHLEAEHITLELIKVIQNPPRVDLCYRIIK